MDKVHEIVGKLKSPTIRSIVLTILLITGCYLILGWVIAINGPALDDFQREFGITVDRVSLTTAFMFIGMMAGDVIATWLLERPGAGKQRVTSHQSFLMRALTFMGECGRGNIAQAVLLQGMAIMSGFFFLISISTRGFTFGLVVIFYLFTGIGNSLIDISANTIVSALDPAVAGSLLNLLHLGFGIGATMAPYIFALFHLGKGYHVAFLVVAIGGGVMIILLHLFLPRATNKPKELTIHMDDLSMEESQQTKEGREKEEKKAKKINERGSASLLENAQPEGLDDSLGASAELATSSDAIVPDSVTPPASPPPSSSIPSDILSSPSSLNLPPPRHFSLPEESEETKKHWEFQHLLNIDFAMLMASILSYNGAEIVLGEWAYDLMEEIGHINYGTAATSLFWAGLLSGRLANSVLGQKFAGLKGTFLLLRLTIAGAIISNVLVVIFPQPPFSIFLFFCSGLTYGGIFPFIVTIVAAVFPDSSGSVATALGCTFFCGNFGATLFPYVTGFIADHASVRTGMALAPMCLLVVGFGITVVWWKVKVKF